MKFFKGYWPFILIAGLGAIVVFLAEPLSRRIEKLAQAPLGHVVGRLTSASGTVHRMHGAVDETLRLPLAQPVEIHDGDRIQTSAASQAVMVLNSQDELELNAASAIELQLWNSKDANSPIYINLLDGGVSSRRAGIKGKAYLVKDGRLYLPGQTPVKKAMALTVLRKAPLDMHLDSSNSDDGAGDFAAGNGGEETANDVSPSIADPDTLSNEYIDETILGHQGQLQKCWLTRLKDVPTLKGQIVVQFEISKRGKVKEMRIADATLSDEVLQKCVMSVIERIPFRPYKGSEISLSYPINFE